MKKITRLITILVLLFFAGCKGYSLDTVPYLINGTFVMEDNSQVHISRRGFFAAKRNYEQYLFSVAQAWSQSGNNSEQEKSSG